MAELSFDEILNKLTQNPDIMAKIRDISKGGDATDLSEKLPLAIEAISPLLNSNTPNKQSEETQSSDTPAAKNEKSPFSSLPIPIDRLGEKISKSAPLLLALKPYLSKERSDIIESIVRVAQITDIMKLTK